MIADFDAAPVWLSLRSAAAATLVIVLLGTAAARWMAGKRGALRTVFDTLFTVPLVLPPTVVGHGLLLLLGRQGLLGPALERMDLRIPFTWSATVIAGVVSGFPLMYLAARAAFEQLDPRLAEAARTLGASELRVFWRISLPLARAGLLAGALLAFARALGEFGATLMLAGNIPGRTQTLPLAIFFAVEGGHNDAALAWVVTSLLISLSAVLIVNLWPRRSGA